MQRMRMAFAVLCATALLGGAAWSVDLPFYNQSFESYEMVEGGYYGLGLDFTGTWYPYALGWAFAQLPLAQSVEVAGAPDGDRVLLIWPKLGDTYHYTSGIWGEANGITHLVQASQTYTVSVQVSKVPGLVNTGAELRILLGDKGTWNGMVQSVVLEIPEQTQDGVWNTYSVTFNSDDYGGAITGKYISLIQLYAYGPTNSQIGVYFDDVRIDGPVSTIVGTVTLSDWTPADPDKALTPVKIELIPQIGGIAQTQVVVLDETDSYGFQCEPGTYDIAFTVAGWLKKLETGVVVESGLETVSNVVLINGDVSGDNQIGTPDYDVVSGNFDEVGD